MRKLAAQKLGQGKSGQTPLATALGHEAHLRLGVEEKARHLDSDGLFFVTETDTMSRILVDRARSHGVQKRGARLERIDLPEPPRPRRTVRSTSVPSMKP